MSQRSGSSYSEPNPRRDSLIPPLAGLRVMVVGLGGGAPIPVELAKCGIVHFDLVDFDTLEASNLIRHPCGVKFVGQNKAVAVQSYLSEMTGGAIQAIAHTFDIFKEPATTRSLVERCDILIIATDNEASKFFLNELAVECNKPAIFVGMFEGGRGGEIFAALPEQACYGCLAETIGRKEFIKTYTQAVAKGDCTSVRDTRAMPGLGIDQGILCHLAARKALDVLLQNKNHSLPSIGTNWIIWSLAGIPVILEETITSIQVDVHRHDACFACAT